MLKSNTSSPNKPWACALFPRAVDLDPARHGPKHILSARVSWLLPWRPRQIRHDECRLFAVWQTHSFTVGWCLHEEQCCATLSLRGKEGGREGKKNKDNKNGEKRRKKNENWVSSIQSWKWDAEEWGTDVCVTIMHIQEDTMTTRKQADIRTTVRGVHLPL